MTHRKISLRSFILALPIVGVAVAAAAFIYFKNFPFLPSTNTAAFPQPVHVVLKPDILSNVRQAFEADKGGTLQATTTQVVMPPQFTTKQKVVVSYQSVNTPNIVAANQVGDMFELRALTNSGEQVHQFDKPLQLIRPLTDEDLKGKNPSDFAFYFLDVKTQKWVQLPSHYDAQNHQLIADTTHFTTFAVASGDPMPA